MRTYRVAFFVPKLSRIKIDKGFCFLLSEIMLAIHPSSLLCSPLNRFTGDTGRGWEIGLNMQIVAANCFRAPAEPLPRACSGVEITDKNKNKTVVWVAREGLLPLHNEAKLLLNKKDKLL